MTTRPDVQRCGWKLSGASFEQPDDVIRVWRIRLDAFSWQHEPLARVLSADEQERAARYYFDRDRRRFTVVRASLRFILGGYLATGPEQVLFNYGKFGKPSPRFRSPSGTPPFSPAGLAKRRI